MMKMVNVWTNEFGGNLYKNGNIWTFEYKNGAKHRVPVLSENQAIKWCELRGFEPMDK